MRQFNRLKKQVDDRVRHSRPRGNIHTLVHDMLVYLLELKRFHVKHHLPFTEGERLEQYIVDLQAAGEHLEESTKRWLSGSE